MQRMHICTNKNHIQNIKSKESGGASAPKEPIGSPADKARQYVQTLRIMRGKPFASSTSVVGALHSSPAPNSSQVGRQYVPGGRYCANRYLRAGPDPDPTLNRFVHIQKTQFAMTFLVQHPCAVNFFNLAI